MVGRSKPSRDSHFARDSLSPTGAPRIQKLVGESLARSLEYGNHCLPGVVSIAHERGQRSRLGMGHVLGMPSHTTTPVPPMTMRDCTSANPDTRPGSPSRTRVMPHAGTMTRTSAPSSRGRSSPLGSRSKDTDLPEPPALFERPRHGPSNLVRAPASSRRHCGPRSRSDLHRAPCLWLDVRVLRPGGTPRRTDATSVLVERASGFDTIFPHDEGALTRNNDRDVVHVVERPSGWQRRRGRGGAAPKKQRRHARARLNDSYPIALQVPTRLHEPIRRELRYADACVGTHASNSR